MCDGCPVCVNSDVFITIRRDNKGENNADNTDRNCNNLRNLSCGYVALLCYCYCRVVATRGGEKSVYRSDNKRKDNSVDHTVAQGKNKKRSDKAEDDADLKSCNGSIHMTYVVSKKP